MPTLRERVGDFVRQSSQLGMARTVQLRAARRLGVSEVKVASPSIGRRVFVRVADSDIYDFNATLGRSQARLPAELDPKVIVDVGANVGYTVLRFRHAFPAARIIAIEPEANNLEQLKRNCSGIADLAVEDKALWSHPATLKITNRQAGSNGFMVAEDAAGDIQAVSILDVMARHAIDEIDLLKIDIEGSELEVFSHPSSQAWLPRVKALLIETHEHMKPGSSEAVRRATAGHLNFRGHVGEYEYYSRYTPCHLSLRPTREPWQ